MGVPDRSLFDLIEKVRSWIHWGGRDQDLSGVSKEFWTCNNSSRMCCECEVRLTEFSLRYHCQSCGRVLCGKCVQGMGASIVVTYGCRSNENEECIKFCKFCFQSSTEHETEKKCNDKIHPCTSPHQSHERAETCFSGKKLNTGKPFQRDQLTHFLEAQEHGGSPYTVASSSAASSIGHPSPVSFHRSNGRSNDEDEEDTGKHFLSPSSYYCQDISDIDSSSVSARHEFYSFKSCGSSPFDSPSRMTSTPNRAIFSVQRDRGGSPRSQSDVPFGQGTMAVLGRPETETDDLENTDDCSDDLSIFRDTCEKVQQPLDFENNGLIWFPPPPDEEEDEFECNFLEYDDDDDDVGESGTMFSSSSFSIDTFAVKEKSNEGHKEPLRTVVHGHFRALVSQLLQGEGINIGNESGEDWLDIVTSVAWRAANFVKPDTSRGGSMDPGDYVKIKCIVSGSPSESTLIKGVVCTKNIKHKRMTSQYKNPRLLILGGALEYQRVSNQLASFDTLLQQEIDHLKMIVSKIEAHRPNVLLVEKSVSSYAQEYLLAKEISLVLNVKRPLLERIARCTGALIVPSIDSLSSARLGHCEIFRLEKVSEECVIANHPNKKSSKTLMFFEGCPRRLGCTVLLRGTCREELKKVKDVVQYAVFAAYHLSLETSFLADEGASLPKIPLKHQIMLPERMVNADSAISVVSNPTTPTAFLAVANEPQYMGARNKLATSSPHPSDFSAQLEGSGNLKSKIGEWELSSEYLNRPPISAASPETVEPGVGRAYSDAYNDHLCSHVGLQSCTSPCCKDLKGSSVLPSFIRNHSHIEFLESSGQEGDAITLRNHRHPRELLELRKTDRVDGDEVSSEYFSAADNHQSILVSFSSRCILKGTVCERSQLLRIKFYGSFDKPLGRYLRNDLFDQTSCCRSCNEPAEAHVRCYTHQQGSLSINVKCIPSLKLSGERDGKIWMWHRCLKCAHKDGVPPATRRVVMSDAAWGLSFGKFLELSFSNHATANRVANCGHSLQRDCLRYYGFGSMVAFFRYSPIDILSVCLPPSILEFNGYSQQEWVRSEATELFNKVEFLYKEISDALHSIEHKSSFCGHEPSDVTDFYSHIMELKDLLTKERSEYDDLLQPAGRGDSQPSQMVVDILDLNCLRRCLLINSYIWDRRLYLLASLKTKCCSNTSSKVDPCALEGTTFGKLKDSRSEAFNMDGKLGSAHEENILKSLALLENSRNALHFERKEERNLPFLEPSPNQLVKMDSLMIESVEGSSLEELELTSRFPMDKTSLASIPSPGSNLSDKIDLAWTGTGQQPVKAQISHTPQPDGQQFGSVGLINQMDSPSYRRLMPPVRVYSFDSALRIRKGLSASSLHLPSFRSFHASGDYRHMVKDPIPNMVRTYSQISPRETQKLNFILSSTPLVISSASHMADEGVRLVLPQTGHNSIVVAVYDNEPTSIISYAINSKDYEEWIADKLDEHEGSWNGNGSNKEDDLSNRAGSHHAAAAPTFSVWNSFGSLDPDDIHYRSYVSDDPSSAIGSLFSDPKKSHVRISFVDESSSTADKVKFSVTCYFAKEFDALRKKCCPSEVDFIRSLSRCRRWSAQGGKSNVYFAKSLDERFIIKQVTKTELDSFEEFAPQYFKYLTDSLTSGSPTCLAKVLGIYQVSVKHLKGGKETKIDLMVMENLFFRRSISRVYDLKGSARSRYNPDTTGKNKVLLDMNLLETLRTKPIFLGSKAKRSLERAVWNDTNFLASVDVMDYSLLVGVDEERNELVLGIIDFMRQYTWDKHLETWVKASGILGGPKNASPTVVSPKQYKKRFRKAMSNYFLTVPDQWSS